MTANKTRPVQATAPKRIYLQGGPQLPENIDFSALSEVTWCRDDVDGTGIPYVRADLAGAAPAAVAGPVPAGWRLVPATPTRDWIASVADGVYEYCDCASLIADILSRAPAAPALEAPAATGFGLDAEQLERLRTNGLKPEEISGAPDVQHARVRELLHWFARLATGHANPKWLSRHAMELAYYLGTEGTDRGLDIEAIKKASYMEGVNISAQDRGILERLGTIPVAAPQAPAAPSYPPAFGPNDWVMSVAGTVVKLSEWEPGAVKARTIYGDAAPAAPAVDASDVELLDFLQQTATAVEVLAQDEGEPPRFLVNRAISKDVRSAIRMARGKALAAQAAAKGATND